MQHSSFLVAPTVATVTATSRSSNVVTWKQVTSTECYVDSAVTKEKSFSLTTASNTGTQQRILAADSLHPSFEGVALVASHIRELCCKRNNKVSLWCEFSSCYPSHGVTQTSPMVCYPQPFPDAEINSPVLSRKNLSEEIAQTTPSLGRRYPSRKNPSHDNATK
ncbi:hypothetical protein HPB51_023324 [Rhipicephalus microplus]|uniref:Uncharacterized protein n=1 Tax=Rhipicephalus microplus TaxID=6941 RepID=A0A9J6ECT7_RHIMP|nr:hypothetical protein HPB51_023324 [Rhipicephalus microplus]